MVADLIWSVLYVLSGGSENPKYYLPEEISDTMYGRMIRIIGGPFGSRWRRLAAFHRAQTNGLLVEPPTFGGVKQPD